MPVTSVPLPVVGAKNATPGDTVRRYVGSTWICVVSILIYSFASDSLEWWMAKVLGTAGCRAVRFRGRLWKHSGGELTMVVARESNRPSASDIKSGCSPRGSST